MCYVTQGAVTDNGAHATAAPVVDLLGDDLLGMGGSAPSTVAAPKPATGGPVKGLLRCQ